MTETHSEGKTHSELIYDICEQLEIRAYGTASTTSDATKRRILATLEMLDVEQLHAIFTVSARVANMAHPFSLEEEKASSIYWLKNCIYSNDLDSITLIASALDKISSEVTPQQAAFTLNLVSGEMFELSDPELIAAHIDCNVFLGTHRTKYSPALMLLVHTHPDKVNTIKRLMKPDLGIRLGYVPSHREVMLHHGIQPALAGGVL